MIWKNGGAASDLLMKITLLLLNAGTSLKTISLRKLDAK